MYVTDDTVTNDTRFFTILESALKGGASCIQLREKNSSTLAFYNRAVKAKTLCQTYKVPLLINDRLDIALAVDADGVHMGQNDMPYTVTRQLLGANKIIGLSVSNKKQAEKANLLDVNYIGLSPIFATQTKTKNLAEPLGVHGLKAIHKNTQKPIVCIGGIHLNNAKQLFDYGASGIAVVSAISKSDAPKTATQKLKTLV